MYDSGYGLWNTLGHNIFIKCFMFNSKCWAFYFVFKHKCTFNSCYDFCEQKLPILDYIKNVGFKYSTMVLMLSVSIPIHLIDIWDTGFFQPMT